MGIIQLIYNEISSFKTLHIVRVVNFRIGLIHTLVEAVIIAYIVGYVIFYEKNYQARDTAQSAVTTKVKGIVSTLNRLDLPPEYRRVWDTVDYVIPPQENGAFFVMTNAIVNKPQTFGTCAEDVRKAPCSSSLHCREGVIARGGTGNGVMTGQCISGKQNKTACEITGWCPIEQEDPPNPTTPLLPEAYNFTVLIKNSVAFPKFGKKKRNIPENVGDRYFECRQNSTYPTCPIVTLGYIIDQAGADFNTIAVNGGIINVKIEWNCNLDYDFDTWCQPKYSYDVMDSGKGTGAPGWNFRYASYYRDADGTLSRELIKAYGILFVFTLDGEAGKFSVVPLFLNIGAGLALLGIATFICDFLLLYCVKDRDVYRNHKFQIVRGKEPDGDDLPVHSNKKIPRHRRSNGSSMTSSSCSLNQPTSPSQNGPSDGDRGSPKKRPVPV